MRNRAISGLVHEWLFPFSIAAFNSAAGFFADEGLPHVIGGVGLHHPQGPHVQHVRGVHTASHTEALIFRIYAAKSRAQGNGAALAKSIGKSTSAF
jgi:hypothetical protein